MANKKNKVKFNICNVHYAPITVAEEGTVAFRSGSDRCCELAALDEDVRASQGISWSHRSGWG